MICQPALDNVFSSNRWRSKKRDSAYLEADAMAKMPKYENRMGFDEMMKEIEEGPSRVAALVSGAILEDMLLVTLRFNLIRLSNQDENDLFEGTAPLATFSSRIRLAFALGLVSRSVRSDLMIIKDIRNDFAHELRSIDLSDYYYRQRILDLNSVKDLDARRGKRSGEILRYAVEKLAMFLIFRTTPHHIRADRDVLDQLRFLSYSDFVEVCRRDANYE